MFLDSTKELYFSLEEGVIVFYYCNKQYSVAILILPTANNS
jgi:hypothetical protein